MPTAEPELPGNPQVDPPTRTDPSRTDPAHTDPPHTDPAHTDPAQTHPAHTDPAQTHPAQARPERAARAGRTGATSRRTVLTGALIGLGATVTGTGYLINADVLPGRIALARRLGQAGEPAGVPTGPAAAAGAIRRGSFTSVARGGLRTGWVIAYPPGVDPDRPLTPTGRRLPVCIVLHGRGDRADGLLTLGYPAFLATAVRAGLPPFALAAVDGGNRYWHRRADGEDTGAMVLREFLPRLTDAGLAAGAKDRLGLLGWSMGGYGSLLLACELGPGRVAAIVAESPALWRHPGDSAPGAFDDAADFRANDVFDRRAVLSRIPIRIDCGIADPFHSAARSFAAGLNPKPVTDLGAGDHSQGYWRRKAPKAINFIGNHLSSH
jgi:S-formylglutathione hydrolase FrmB